jgi:plastocyanin
MHTATAAVVLLAFVAMTETVIAVTPDHLYPAYINIRRGDRVRWQAADKLPLMLDLEDHRGQHVVITRAGSVAVTFLDAGPHAYVVRLGEGRPLRGEVEVQPGPPVEGAVCALGSNRSLCVEP